MEIPSESQKIDDFVLSLPDQNKLEILRREIEEARQPIPDENFQINEIVQEPKPKIRKKIAKRNI